MPRRYIEENRKAYAAQKERMQYLFKTFNKNVNRSLILQSRTSSTTLFNTFKEEHRTAEAENAANNFCHESHDAGITVG
jgi:hypothetical protein